MSEIKLKPCPFCGGKAKLVYYYPFRYYVSCVVCAAATVALPSEEAAINTWNRRSDNA